MLVAFDPSFSSLGQYYDYRLAVSTSGDYERFFIDEDSGERVHHIIDPQTGESAAKVSSVTVLGNKGLDTDPLPTSVFVLGVEKGLALIAP